MPDGLEVRLERAGDLPLQRVVDAAPPVTDDDSHAMSPDAST